MRPIDDPSSMTPDERLFEVASILATGILRLHAGSALTTDRRDPQKSLDSATAGLELSEETVLSVQRGYLCCSSSNSQSRSGSSSASSSGSASDSSSSSSFSFSSSSSSRSPIPGSCSGNPCPAGFVFTFPADFNMTWDENNCEEYYYPQSMRDEDLAYLRERQFIDQGCDLECKKNPDSLKGTTGDMLPSCYTLYIHINFDALGTSQIRFEIGLDTSWGFVPFGSCSIRRGVHLRMVNVGASSMIQQDTPELGYPVCTVCGQSVSPLASDRQLQSFDENHEKRCGKKPEHIGFFADIVADCLTLPACANQTEAYSVLEALRMSAAHVLDTHLEDLQILVVGHVDRDEVVGVLWDPMLGGSGLLVQILDNFAQIVEHALEIALGCPSACASSCIDCLQTFRNRFYHKYLDRHVAAELLEQWGETLKEENDIPPTHPTTHVQDLGAQPVNNPETKLKHLLDAAGFTSGSFQQQIRFKTPIVLDYLIGSTTPDVYFLGDEIPVGTSADMIAKTAGYIERMVTEPMARRRPRASKEKGKKRGQ